MKVHVLDRREDGVRFDPVPVAALYAELGESGAEQVLATALADLGARLSDMVVLVRGNAADRAAAAARDTARLAARLGLVTLVRVAGDVAAAVAAGDRTAQAATVARLVRTADGSLSRMRELQRMLG